jgi:DNA-binding MarR family transcriptional regulator
MPKLNLDDEGRVQVNRLFRSMRTFKLLNDRMPLQYVLAFLAVATEEGESVTYYAQKLGTNQTTMSRHLLDIGPSNRNHGEGYGLIDYRSDPLERRKHQYFLTPKGRQFVETILKEAYS